METISAKERILDDLGRIRAEILDLVDLSVMSETSSSVFKRKIKNRLGDFERQLKELLEKLN